MAWSVYVLFSGKLRRTYVGCSHDVQTRLEQHNAGVTRATRGGAPWNIIYTEEAGTYAEARRQERYFKSAAGRRRLKTILE